MIYYFYLPVLTALGICCTMFCCLFAKEISQKFAEYDKYREEYRKLFGPHAIMIEKKREYYQAIFFTTVFILLAIACFGTIIHIYTSYSC